MDEPCVEIIKLFSATKIIRSHSSLEHLRAICLPRHADVIAEMLQQLGIDQVDVFGVSWGGALAQEFALRYRAWYAG